MKPFERWSLWVTTLLTGGTGLAYWWVKYFMEPTQPWAVINHPIQPWLLKTHIVVAPLLVFAVGMVALGHIWRHFRARVRWGRKTGLTAMLSLAPMVLTGYAIQVLTHEGWLRAMAWSHIGFGVVFLLGFVLHARVFRGPPPPNGTSEGGAGEGTEVGHDRTEEGAAPDGGSTETRASGNGRGGRSGRERPRRRRVRLRARGEGTRRRP